MNYRLEIPASVLKEVKGLPGHVRAQARQLFRALTSEPRHSRSKELRGYSDIYRIWLAGRWRVVYHVDDDLKRIRILRVRRKESIDYENLEPPD